MTRIAAYGVEFRIDGYRGDLSGCGSPRRRMCRSRYGRARRRPTALACPRLLCLPRTRSGGIRVGDRLLDTVSVSLRRGRLVDLPARSVTVLSRCDAVSASVTLGRLGVVSAAPGQAAWRSYR